MHAARYRNLCHTGLFYPVLHNRPGDFFQHMLVGRRDVPFGKSLCKGAGKKVVQTTSDLNIAVLTVETFQQRLPKMARIAVCRQPDDLSLVTPGAESKRAGDELVIDTERVGEIETMQHTDSNPVPQINSPAATGTVPVQHHHQAFLETGGIERICSVRIVVMEAFKLLCQPGLDQALT